MMTLKKGLFTTALLFSALSQVQARTIYWTGQATVYAGRGAEYACQREATRDGEVNAKQSCVYDFGIRRDVCDYAPVVKTEYFGSSYDYGQVSCSVRVYIQVP